MSAKAKYQKIDQSKLSDNIVKLLNVMKDKTDNFTNEEVIKKSNVEGALDKLIKKYPDAVKKSKPSRTKKQATKSTTPNKRTELMDLARKIRKKDETWQAALKRAKSEINKEDEKATSKVKDELEKLKQLIEDDDVLRGFKKSDLSRDAKLKAKPRGKRKSTAGWKNQYGASKGGRTYYENRENRSDRYSPKYPKDKPFLASGGHLAQGDLQQLDIANADLFAKGGGVEDVNESANEAKTYKKGDKFKSTHTGEILFIIEPKGDGYDYRMSSDLRSKTHAPKAWFDMMIKTGKLVPESVVTEAKTTYAKGGETRSKRSINTDRARLSKEPWEQAYLPKRKGSYYAKGGDVLEIISFDSKRDADDFLRTIEYTMPDSDDLVRLNDTSIQFLGSNENRDFVIERASSYDSYNKFAKGGMISSSDLDKYDKMLDNGEDVVVYDKNGTKYIYQGSSFEKDSVAVMKGFDESTYRMMPLNQVKSIEIGSLYAKGGALENSTYIPKGDIISVRLKNGKQYENDYNEMEFLNGIYISNSLITKESEEQMSLFKKGGKLPKGSIYIKRRDIDFVEYGDEDEPERADGKNLVGGIWIDPIKQKTLIEEARKSGRLEAGGDLQQLDIANADLFAKGGYLSDHGLMEGDTIIKTVGSSQKIKDKDGKILFVNLENGYRDSEPPLPFEEGGEIDAFELQRMDCGGYLNSVVSDSTSNFTNYYLESGGELNTVVDDSLSHFDNFYLMEGSGAGMFAKGGRLKSALNRDRKYFNKNESWERAYNKGKDRKGYKSFSKGGILSPIERYVLEIEGITGVRKNAVENFISDNKLTDEQVLHIVIGLGRKQLKASEFRGAAMGNSEKTKNVLKFAKSKKAVMLEKGGETRKIEIINEGVAFTPSKYKAIYEDYDNDGTVNIDDANPLQADKKNKVEQVEFRETFDKLLDVKSELDDIMNEAVKTLDEKAPKGADIYARTKTPYSILKKLVEKRMLDPNRGLTDMIGTTIAVNDQAQLEDVRDQIDNGLLGKVLDRDDYYKSPKAGYRAYHYIVEYKGVPVEVQLKTKQQKKLHEVSHEYYKKGTLNPTGLNQVSILIEKSDRGDAKAKAKVKELFKSKTNLGKKIASKTFKKGGAIDDLRKPMRNIDIYEDVMLAKGGKVTFEQKSKAIAKNFEGKRVEPKYQKEYGKTYSKEEAKEVGNKIAGSMKSDYDSKLENGGKTATKKRGNPNSVFSRAKKIRKQGETWQAAVKRAKNELDNEK